MQLSDRELEKCKLKNWFWYICREDELLLDLDSEWRLHHAIEKLQRIDRQHRIVNVWAYPSYSNGKWHVVALHDSPELLASPRLRTITAWWCGSDPVRAMYNLVRMECMLPAPDLLIAPREWPHFRRSPDYVCTCATKHKGEDACAKCPVFCKLHGTHAGIAYFPLIEKREITPGVQPWPRSK